MYLYRAYASDVVLRVFCIRALISVPAHALFSCMWGYALGQAKFTEAKRGGRFVLRGLLLAMVLHGLFNLLATAGPVFSLGLVAFVAAAWWGARRRIAQALADSPHDVETP